MKRILVTGGAGYLGSVLVRTLLARGHHVTVVDSLRHNQPSLLGFCHEPHFDFVRGDVRDEALMHRLVRDKDAIVPLAAIVGLKACANDPPLAWSVNYDAVVLLNKLRSPQQAVVWPCTNSGYGTRSGDVHCTEETPLEPISVYGESKAKAEEELLSKPNAVSFRLATVFGPSPRMRLDLLVNDFVWRAVSDGFLVIYEKDFKRNYVHIADVADAFCFGLDHGEAMSGQAYNVGLDGANLSKAELVERIKEFVPKLYVHYAEVGSDPDKRNYVVSNAKLRLAGFEARRSLEEGIGQLLKAYRMLPGSVFHNS